MPYLAMTACTLVGGLAGDICAAARIPSFAGGFQRKKGAIFTRYLSIADC